MVGNGTGPSPEGFDITLLTVWRKTHGLRVSTTRETLNRHYIRSHVYRCLNTALIPSALFVSPAVSQMPWCETADAEYCVYVRRLFRDLPQTWRTQHFSENGCEDLAEAQWFRPVCKRSQSLGFPPQRLTLLLVEALAPRRENNFLLIYWLLRMSSFFFLFCIINEGNIENKRVKPAVHVLMTHYLYSVYCGFSFLFI